MSKKSIALKILHKNKWRTIRYYALLWWLPETPKRLHVRVIIIYYHYYSSCGDTAFYGLKYWILYVYLLLYNIIYSLSVLDFIRQTPIEHNTTPYGDKSLACGRLSHTALIHICVCRINVNDPTTKRGSRFYRRREIRKHIKGTLMCRMTAVPRTHSSYPSISTINKYHVNTKTSDNAPGALFLKSW